MPTGSRATLLPKEAVKAASVPGACGQQSSGALTHGKRPDQAPAGQPPAESHLAHEAHKANKMFGKEVYEISS